MKNLGVRNKVFFNILWIGCPMLPVLMSSCQKGSSGINFVIVSTIFQKDNFLYYYLLRM